MKEINYVIRIYENKFFGRYVGKNKKNVDLYNGSVNICGTGYFVFDLRELEMTRFGADTEERKKLFEIATSVAKDVIGVRDPYGAEVIYARLHEWDQDARQKKPAKGVFVFSQEERKVAVALEGYSTEPILICDSIYSCPPKGDSKNRPLFFVSSYDVSEAAQILLPFGRLLKKKAHSGVRSKQTRRTHPMSIIDQLKLTQEQRPAELSPEQRLRHKMCEALDKQLAAAIHDAGEGRPYERYEIEEVENPETGEVETRKVKKRFSRWWFLGDNGSYYFSLRYGGKSIEIKPKKTSIEVADEKQLVDTIKALQEAIKAGELDAPLKKAADARKAQFQKRSAKSAAQTAQPLKKKYGPGTNMAGVNIEGHAQLK